MVSEARWAGNLLAVLLLWPDRLANIISPREFGPTLTSYRTHRCTNNFPTDGANCRVVVLGSGPLQWICREWVWKLGSDKATTRFVGGGGTYRIGRPRGLREKGPLARGLGSPTPLASLPSLCEISIVIYPTPPFIFSLHLSVIHVYIWVHVPSATFLALCELLWLPSHCPGVTSTSIGFRGLTVGI